jgi:hypothetical protein
MTQIERIDADFWVERLLYVGTNCPRIKNGKTTSVANNRVLNHPNFITSLRKNKVMRLGKINDNNLLLRLFSRRNEVKMRSGTRNQTAESRISNSVGQRPTRKATLPFVRPERARAKEETKQ